ncbi:MAG: DUF488 domain-containing protein [Solirubrobacterales bacterium]
MSAKREILTVGHSNHDERRFLELLGAGGVEAIADVRAQPHSRRNPHFNADGLAASLKAAGVSYTGFGDQLGGRREPVEGSPNDAWEDPAFRGYADHMESGEFAAGLEMLSQLAASRRTAVMCAEGDWQRCHRRLISDALTARGWRVLHLGPDGSLSEHELDERAVLDGERITYPMPGQTSLEV